jgi:hypothetical protein
MDKIAEGPGAEPVADGRRTLERLEAITMKVRARSGVNVESMQLAALLLEKTTGHLSEAEAKDLVDVRRRGSR